MRPRTREVESNYRHFERDDVALEYASFNFLLPPEEVILRQLQPRLEQARTLDVGIGGGRTTGVLAPRVREYVGIDVSHAMLAQCRRRFGAESRVATRLVRADVRHLPFPDDPGFDLVLFSFNGLDGVGGHEERLRALSEIRRVCRPGGRFCFSSDNLAFVAERLSPGAMLRQTAEALFSGRRSLKLFRHPRRLVSSALDPWRWRALNTSVGPLKRLEHATIVIERFAYEARPELFAEPGRRILLDGYCIRPAAQVQQLHDAGFEHVRVFAPDGRDVTDHVGAGLAEHRWLYYLCTRSAHSAR